MKNKFAWVGIPVAAMVIAATVFLLDRSAPSPDEGAFPPAQQSEVGRATPDAPASPADGPAASTAEAEMVIRSTETTGDLTMSDLAGGELGYLDVDSIINNNDPYSIVALLQAHRDLTGADESLEIEIRYTIDYPTGIVVAFDQLIDGKRTPEGKGSILFDPATGAVKDGNASLITPDPALAGSVAILQEEAVAIAREAVASAVLQEEGVAIARDGDTLYVQPRLRPGFTFQISRVTPKELRYALDPETNKTRAEWPVWIGARGVAGGLSWEVLVDASTGEIAGINDLVQRYAGGCSDLTFRVCDGSLMSHEDDECGEGILKRVKPLPDSHPDAASAIRYAKGMTADVKAANSSYIGKARGSETKGDRTHFSMNHGDIGYVDVYSIMQDRNPYSIVDLLQAHQELTGADDSLEITIEEISENAIWGQKVLYRQVIDGQSIRQGGKVFFQPDGTVTRMVGNLVSSQSLNAGDVLILSPEAEAIALNVAARYAENIELAHPERSDVPVTLTALSAEMGYELDSDSNLVRLWNVHVGIAGPVGDILRVSISPDTGEVVRVGSAVVRCG